MGKDSRPNHLCLLVTSLNQMQNIYMSMVDLYLLSIIFVLLLIVSCIIFVLYCNMVLKYTLNRSHIASYSTRPAENLTSFIGIVKTQHNHNQVEVGLTTLWVGTHPPTTHHPTTHPPTTNFQTTSRPPRKLIFGMQPYFNPTR